MASSAKSLNEKKSGGKVAPAHFLFQLAAALDNPTIKSLEWHEDGKGILLHTSLYEEEIQRHQDLFPELRNLKPVSVLQAWLTTYGFKAKITKQVRNEPDILAFQHANFKKLSLWAVEGYGPKADAPLKPEVPKQPKKSKKRKSSTDTIVTPSGNTLPPESVGAERKSQRLRPLYQYINYDNPEMNKPLGKECDLNQQETPPTRRSRTAPLELKITPNTDDKGKELKGSVSGTSGATVRTEVDKSTQVDISKMLSVCAAHLVPPLSPQHK